MTSLSFITLKAVSTEKHTTFGFKPNMKKGELFLGRKDSCLVIAAQWSTLFTALWSACDKHRRQMHNKRCVLPVAEQELK